MKKLKNSLYFLSLFLLSLLFCAGAEAATQVYRSVGPGNTAALAVGTANALNISGSTAAFASALPLRVGVGDVLEYDSDNNGTVDALAFVSARISATQLALAKANGSALSASLTGDKDWSLHRAYTSLSEAENGTENAGINSNLRNFDTWVGGNDLVAGNLQWNIACYGDNEDDTAGVVLQDWTTDSSHMLKIYTPYLTSEVGASQRHNGAWTANAYRLVIPGTQSPEGSAIGVNVAGGTSINVWIDGLQISTESTDMNLNGIEIFDVTGDTKISNNLIRTDSSLISGSGIKFYNYGSNGTLKAWNNVISGFAEGGINLDASGNIAYAYNNTVYGQAGYDICYNAANGEIVSKNNIAQNCASDFSGSFGVGSSNNLSDLFSAPGLGSRTESLTFADALNQDFHLASSDTAAKGAGAVLSTDTALSFTTDFENQSRGNAWDMGADQTIAADTAAPVLSQVTPVPALTSINTPKYTFSSSEAGAIAFGGDCRSATLTAVAGNNTISFLGLADGTHSNCTIKVTDASGNASSLLPVNAFTVDTAAPVLVQTVPVPTPTTNPTPSYSFSSTEAGTISYGGGCSSNATTAVVGGNTVTFSTLSTGTYGACTVKVIDAAGNSGSLAVNSFTVEGEFFILDVLGEASKVYNTNAFVPLDSVTTPLYNKVVTAKIKLSQQARYAIAYFIHFGTPSTMRLGAEERANVLLSYKLTYGSLPQSLSNWQDVISISNAQWPARRSSGAERTAKTNFKKVYLRAANLLDANDMNAVFYMAYGLRPLRPDLNAEASASQRFVAVYFRQPSSVGDWNIIRGIAYSGVVK